MYKKKNLEVKDNDHILQFHAKWKKNGQILPNCFRSHLIEIITKMTKYCSFIPHGDTAKQEVHTAGDSKPLTHRTHTQVMYPPPAGQSWQAGNKQEIIHVLLAEPQIREHMMRFK